MILNCWQAAPVNEEFPSIKPETAIKNSITFGPGLGVILVLITELVSRTSTKAKGGAEGGLSVEHDAKVFPLSV